MITIFNAHTRVSRIRDCHFDSQTGSNCSAVALKKDGIGPKNHGYFSGLIPFIISFQDFIRIKRKKISGNACFLTLGAIKMKRSSTLFNAECNYFSQSIINTVLFLFESCKKLFLLQKSKQ